MPPENRGDRAEEFRPRWDEAIRRDCEPVRPSPTALVGVLALLAALRVSNWPAHWHSRRV